MKNEQRIQEIIFDYFRDMDNNTVSLFIDSFVYHTPITKKNGISELIDKFLKDNGLVNAYLNYLEDMKRAKEKTASFFKSSGSDSHMIQTINMALLNLAYNRFRRIDHTKAPESPKAPVKKQRPDAIKILGTSEIEKSVHIASPLNENYTLCSIMLDGNLAGDSEPTNDKIDCDHCKQIVKTIKKTEL